jgi:hypothetical protein
MDDLTFAGLISDLRDAPVQIEAQIRRVPADRWDETMPGAEAGWTRRQLLAHMAANDIRQITRVRVGADIGGQADRDALSEQGDVDAWNQAQVDLRRGRSVDDLVTEMHARRSEFVALLESLTPEQRSQPMPFRADKLPLTAAVPLILGHLAQHAGELAP